MTDQQKAFQKFSRLKCGALFMSTGTGKTRVALELAEHKTRQGKCNFVLYILPASLLAKGDIEKERSKWTPSLAVHYATCEGIGSSAHIYLEVLRSCEAHKVFCIVDESLKIKNIDAKRTKRILSLTDKTAYRLVLNGTPLTKNVLDLWSQMQFLSPKILNMTFKKFKDTFCEYNENGRWRGFVRKQANIPYLISIVKPYVFQADLDLEAKKNYCRRYYSVGEAEYNEVKNAYFERCWGRDNLNFEAFSTLLQKHYTGTMEHDKAVSECLTAVDGQAIVFVKYLANIPKNAKHIVGEMNEKERKSVLSDFESGKFKTLYMTYGVGAFGLNLQFCRNIVFADHTFDYATRLQAEGRIYRLGTESDVFYTDIICDNSGLEDMILQNLKKKCGRLAEVKNELNLIRDKASAKKYIEENL